MTRRLKILVPCLCLSLSLAGCGETYDGLNVDGAGAGQDGFSQDAGLLDDAGSLDGPIVTVDFGQTADGPMITVTSPMPNPASPPEVAGDLLRVTAQVTPVQGAILDAASVQLVIAAPGGAGTTSVSMSLTGQGDQYAGEIDISHLPSGMTNFIVTATDTQGRRGAADVAFVHDRGPTITFTQPSAMTLKGALTVSVIVSDPLHPLPADALTRKDPLIQAGLRTLGDIALTSGTAVGTSFVATGSVNLTDTLKFDPLPDGPQLITVEAKNEKGTTTRAIKAVTVDKVGPEITVLAPTPGQFLGGVIEVKAEIMDLSAINEASVVAVFGNDPTKNLIKLRRTSATTNVFSGFFDVRQLGPNYVLPTLSVRAKDVLDNQGEKALEVIVDNTRPQIDMDPPHLRVSKLKEGKRYCSGLFDPVGAEAADDGYAYPQILTPRARIEDRGNRAPGLLVERYSGLEASSVVLYAIPAGSGANASVLLVDTDGDGYCDDVNPELVPTSSMTTTMSNQALALNMAPIVSGGKADYANGVDNGSAYPGCQAFGGDADPPAPLCLESGTTLSLSLPWTDEVPPIFSIPPVTGTPTGCVGFQLDTLNRIEEGALCLAVRAVDKAGNINVSRPLRVCVDRGGGKCTGWSTGGATWRTDAPYGPYGAYAPSQPRTSAALLPNCTGTLAANGTVDKTKPCVPWQASYAGLTYQTTYPPQENRLIQ